MKFRDIVEGTKEENLEEARATNIMGFLGKLAKESSDIEKLVDLWSQADGFAALYRMKDGNAYEVTVRPAQFADHPGIQKKTKKR